MSRHTAARKIGACVLCAAMLPLAASCDDAAISPVVGTWQATQATSSGFLLRLVIYENGDVGSNGGWGSCNGKILPSRSGYRIMLDCGVTKSTGDANLTANGHILRINWPDGNTHELQKIS